MAKKLILILALLAALCSSAWAEVHWNNVVIQGPTADIIALRPQAEEYGSGNDYLDWGEWTDGSRLENCIVDDPHLTGLEAWVAESPATRKLYRHRTELPTEIRSDLNSPQGKLMRKEWAGWSSWADSQ